MSELRRIFDEAAELYDRARPAYLPQVVEDLVGLAGIDAESRVLEIGVGTGQLTSALAEYGCEIVGVELGASLAERASANLQRYPRVTVVNSAFEEWTLPEEPFDAVVAATAFHWLDPQTRIGKAGTALRAGGALGIISTHHVAGGSSDFFVDVQACYERWDPATPPGLRLAPAEDIPVETDELGESGMFGPAAVRRYEWEQSYTTAEYRDLLLTYSGHRALDVAARGGLLDCIAELIETRHAGRITKRYMTELLVARRLP